MAAAIEMSANRATGIVRWFNSSKGSGFVSPDNGGGYLYFHQPSLKSGEHDGNCSLDVGVSVEFEVRADWDRRPRAFGITAPDSGVLTGGSHLDRCDCCGGGASYGDGDLSRGSESGHNGGGDRCCCVVEATVLPVLPQGTALFLFDEMPLKAERTAKPEQIQFESSVVWDEESEHVLDSDCALLDLLAQREDYLRDDEAMPIVNPDIHDELLARINGIHSPLELHLDTVLPVFDEMPHRDVVWDEELHDLDSHDGLLRQLAQGRELMGDQQNVMEISLPSSALFDLIPEDDNLTLLSKGTAMCSAHQVLDKMPSLNVMSDNDMSQECGLRHGLFEELALCGEYLVDEERKPVVEPNFIIKPTNVINTPFLLEISTSTEEGWLGEMSCKNGTEQIMIGSPAAYDEFVCVTFEKMTCVDFVLVEDMIDELVFIKISWRLDGFSPWSKFTDKGLRLVFLADPYLMDMEYMRMYIFFKQWDPGISWLVLDNTRGCTTEFGVQSFSFWLKKCQHGVMMSLFQDYVRTKLNYKAVMRAPCPGFRMGNNTYTKLVAHLRLSFSARSSILTRKLMLQCDSEMAEMLLCWETISCNFDKMMSQAHVLVSQCSLTISMVLLLWLKASRCQTESINHDRTYYLVKIWDPYILRPINMQFEILWYATAGTYEISSPVVFIQSSVMLLVPLFEVLNPAYLKTESAYSILSISTSIWFKLGAILMTSGLKIMAFRLFSQEEMCKSLRSERQQADLGDEEIVVQLGTGGTQEIKSITDSLIYEHQIMILKSSYISIIRQWDPSIAMFRLHEAGDDSLNGRMWAAGNEQASFADHSVAWGQATFRRGGSVTPGSYAICGPLCYQGRAHHGPRRSTGCCTKAIASTPRRGDQKLRTERVIPFLRSSSSRRRFQQLVARFARRRRLFTCSRPGSSRSAATGCDMLQPEFFDDDELSDPDDDDNLKAEDVLGFLEQLGPVEHEEKLNLMKASFGIPSEPSFHSDCHLLPECTRDLRHIGDRVWHEYYHMNNLSETYLPPMRYTQCNADPSDECQCFHEPTPILQIFNMKLQTCQEYVTGPTEVYGIFAVRDGEDYRRNYLFNRPRENPIDISLTGGHISLLSPKRGMSMKFNCLIEVDIRIKAIGDDVSNDKTVVDGCMDLVEGRDSFDTLCRCTMRGPLGVPFSI